MASIFDALIKKVQGGKTPARSVMPVPVVHPVKGVPQRHIGFMAFHDGSHSGTSLEHRRGIMTKK